MFVDYDEDQVVSVLHVDVLKNREKIYFYLFLVNIYDSYHVYNY